MFSTPLFFTGRCDPQHAFTTLIKVGLQSLWFYSRAGFNTTSAFDQIGFGNRAILRTKTMVAVDDNCCCCLR